MEKGDLPTRYDGDTSDERDVGVLAITPPADEPRAEDAPACDAERFHGERTQRTVIEKGVTLLDTYRVESDAKSGGFGRVYRVRHLGWDVDLAMKRPQARHFTNPKQIADFTQECENWIGLGLHPQIVSCHYVREIDGAPSIFAEWMDGGSLRDWIRDGRLYAGSEQDARMRILGVLLDMAHGLSYAHERGLIHRDVKPENILLTASGAAKVADFGIARARGRIDFIAPEPGGEGGGLTVTHLGTLEYCSPEQAANQEKGLQTDIYSFALCALEMYLGRRPWHSGSLVAAAVGDYFSKDMRVPMPAGMEALLRRCLESDRESRPHDFSVIDEKLLEIYRTEAGSEYPQKPFDAVAGITTASILNNHALSFLDLGQMEKAEECWDRALEIDPAHVDSVFNKAFFLWRVLKADGEEAMILPKNLYESRKNDAEVVYLLIMLCVELCEYYEAAVLYQDHRGLLQGAVSYKKYREIDSAVEKACGKFHDHTMRRSLELCEGVRHTDHLAVSPDGVRMLAYSDAGGELWELWVERGSDTRYCPKSAERVSRWEWPDVRTRALCHSEDLKRIVLFFPEGGGGDCGCLRIWDVQERHYAKQLDLPKLRGMATDGEGAAAREVMRAAVRKVFEQMLFGFETGLKDDPAGADMTAVFDASGRVLYWAAVLNAASEQEGAGDGASTAFAASADAESGKDAGNSEPGLAAFAQVAVFGWDTETGICDFFTRIEVGATVDAIRIDAQSREIYIASDLLGDGVLSVRRFEMRSGALVRTFGIPDKSLKSMSLDADFGRMLTFTGGRKRSAWDVVNETGTYRTGRAMREVGATQLWNVRTGEVLEEYLGVSGPVDFCPEDDFAMHGEYLLDLKTGCLCNRFGMLAKAILPFRVTIGEALHPFFLVVAEGRSIDELVNAGLGSKPDAYRILFVPYPKRIEKPYAWRLSRLADIEKAVSDEDAFRLLERDARVRLASGDVQGALELLDGARRISVSTVAIDRHRLAEDVGRYCRISGVRMISEEWAERAYPANYLMFNPNPINFDGAFLDGDGKYRNVYGDEARWDAGETVSHPAFSKDGKIVCYIVEAGGTSSLVCRDTATGELLAKAEAPAGTIAIAVSPDGASILTGSFEGDGSAVLWRQSIHHEILRTRHVPSAPLTNRWALDALHEEMRFDISGRIDGVYFLPDARIMAVSDFSLFGHTLSVWSREDGRKIDGETRTRVFGLDIDRRGERALIGMFDKVELVDLKSFRTLRTFDVGQDLCQNHVRFMPDERFAVTMSSSGALRFWEIETGACLSFRDIGEGYGIAVHPDGARISVGRGAKKCLVPEYDFAFPGWADWDEGARPCLEAFLEMRPEWTDEDFERILIPDLQNRGYGWLRPEGVYAELEKQRKRRKKGLRN
ncbi:hypothetical protein AGMMS49983_10150 [Clostridia bacterium]|nr:hypothetical protein AGMMS49983_10150 [Clostridia bacterium]